MTETGLRTTSLENVVCLIVDDDKFSRNFAKTALYQIGIKNVKEANSVDEAREVVVNSHIDVVLLDQVMPSKSGLEFARELKQSSKRELKNLPIIMVTIDTQEKTVLEAKNLGIQEYLVKPISPMALKKRIATALGLKQERL